MMDDNEINEDSNVFKQLRSLASTITRDTNRLKSLTNISIGEQPQLYDKSADTLKQEVAQLQETTRDLVVKVNSCKEFRSFVEDTKVTIGEKFEHVMRIQEYLQKYGYKPPSDEVVKITIATSPSAQPPSLRPLQYCDDLISSPVLSTVSLAALAGSSRLILHSEQPSSGVTQPSLHLPPSLSSHTASAPPQDTSHCPSHNQRRVLQISCGTILENERINDADGQSLAVSYDEESSSLAPPLQQKVPTIVVLPSSDDKGESSIPSDTRVKMLNGDGIRQPHALTNKQNLNCETPRLLREYRNKKKVLVSSQLSTEVSSATPRTRMNVESWLHCNSFSPSPFNRRLPKKLVNNPLLKNCTATPLRTPLRQERTSASPELPRKNYTKPKCSPHPSGVEVALVSAPAITTYSALNPVLPTVPSVDCAKAYSYLDDSIEEPIYSETTMKIMADMDKAKLSNVKTELDTPEMPVLNASYSSPNIKIIIDTPEEPVLSCNYGKMLHEQNHIIEINSTLQKHSIPTRTLTVMSDNSPVVESQSKQCDNLDDSMEKSPELSDVTKQILFNFNQRNSNPTHSSNSFVDNIFKVPSKENIPPLSRDVLKTVPGQCTDEPLHKKGVGMEPKQYRPRPSFSHSHKFESGNRSELLDHNNDCSMLDVSVAALSRGLVCDNSFSQAMLQYSHVPASPMPTPREPNN